MPKSAFYQSKFDASPRELWTWGSGEEGQLGYNWKQQLAPKKVDFFEGKKVQQCACGTSHTAVALESGELYMMGSDTYGKLGVEEAEKKDKPKESQEPYLVSSLSEFKIKDVSCGEHHTAVVTDDGDVWTFGWGGSFFQGAGGLGLGNHESQSLPYPVESLRAYPPIKHVSCGNYHTAAISEEGQLFTWGRGEYGRLGHGNSSDGKTPEMVRFFETVKHNGGPVKITQVACGGHFTIALTETGQVFSWGRNDFGQLGLGGQQVMDVYSLENVPTEVEIGKKIVNIAAGENHCAVLAEDGTVYLWGARLWLAPREITVLGNSKIVKVQCGAGFSAALSGDGDVYTWGKGRTNALGHDDRKSRAQPEMIKRSAFADKPVVDIACGRKNMAAIV
eukprot:GILJ01005829.1.p1 GENE.GILJ01005829.1~~GILJ01005829.1.p1  ORF type:complete len:443 (+),score=58.28 GILJ01005829.1:159-1331(+)